MGEIKVPKITNEGVGYPRPEGCATSRAKSRVRDKRKTMLKVSAAGPSSQQKAQQARPMGFFNLAQR